MYYLQWDAHPGWEKGRGNSVLTLILIISHVLLGVGRFVGEWEDLQTPLKNSALSFLVSQSSLEKLVKT